MTGAMTKEEVDRMVEQFRKLAVRWRQRAAEADPDANPVYLGMAMGFDEAANYLDPPARTSWPHKALVGISPRCSYDGCDRVALALGGRCAVHREA